MGRATASVQFRTQVILVYLQYISAKIHSKCASQPKIAKKLLKTHILGVQCHRLWTTGKLVIKTCYDMQQVCLSATVLTLDEPIVVKLQFLFDALV